jgi:hypothetical protein
VAVGEPEQLVELWRITEYRDGAVFKTEYVEDVWIPLSGQPPAGYVHAPKSSNYTGQMFRQGRR